MSEVSPDSEKYLRRSLVVVGVVVLAVVLLYLLRHVSTVFLTAFGGVLLAVLLDALTEMLRRRSPLSRKAAWALVAAAFAAVLAASFWFVGPNLASQLDELGVRLPDAVAQLRSQLSDQAWGRFILRNLPEDVSISDVGSFRGVFATALGAVGNVLVVLFVALYVAFDPRLYRDGLLSLLPKSRRERGDEIVSALGRALRHWLAGRFASMVVVGILTSAVLAVIGFPLALTLGFIAAAFSFVPYLGPIASAIPAVLVGLLESPRMAVYAVIVYTAVQLLESYTITPLIQRKAVSLPPALLIVVQVMGGLLFGIMGILLATPLTVCIIVLVQMLYVQDVLGDDTVRPLGS